MGLFDFGFNFSKNTTTSGLSRKDTKWMYEQQSKQWKNNTEWYNKYGYEMLRSGLERANYNPLLAVGSTPLNGTGVSGSAIDERSNSRSLSMSGLPFGSNAFTQSLRNLRADTTLKNAQAEEALSRSTLENTEDALKNKELPFKDRQVAAETEGLELNNQYTKSLIRYVKEQTNTEITKQQINKAQVSYTRALEDLSNTQQQHFNKIIESIDAGIELTSADRAWLKAHPKQAEFISGMRRYTGVIGDIVGSVSQLSGSYRNIQHGIGQSKFNAQFDQ